MLNSADDVAVAISGLAPGRELEVGGQRVTTAGPVPPGHKVALRDIPAAAPVRKYGQIIGFAAAPIAAGEHVHTHNLNFGEFARQAPPAEGAAHAPQLPAEAPPRELTFDGYRRADGLAGTRNYLAVVTLAAIVLWLR